MDLLQYGTYCSNLPEALTRLSDLTQDERFQLQIDVSNLMKCASLHQSIIVRVHSFIVLYSELSTLARMDV